MGGVHHFLAAEVPDVERHFFGWVERTGPVADLDAFGGFFTLLEFAGDESLDQRCLADAATAHKNQLGFIEGLGAGALGEIVGEDFLGWLERSVVSPGFGAIWAEHFSRNAQVWVPLAEKAGQVHEGGERVRKGADLIAGEVKIPQLRKPAEGVWKGADLVAG